MPKAVRSLLVTLFLVLVVGALGYVGYQKFVTKEGLVKDAGKDISDYSAVFLTNGQVYFGKIMGLDQVQVDLRDIYYLQVNQQQSLQPDDKKSTDSTQPEVSLVKLGNELHGPNDRMRINREQVLFTESLMSDSKVVKAISDYKAK